MEDKKQVKVSTLVLAIIVTAIVAGLLGALLVYVWDKNYSSNSTNSSTSNTVYSTTTNSANTSTSVNNSSNSSVVATQPSVKVTSEGVIYTNAKGVVTPIKNVPADRGIINKADYVKAEISPNGLFIAMLANLYEGSKVQVFDIANGTSYDLRLAFDSTHSIHGADYQWQSNNKLKVLGVCGIIDECSMFESADTTMPWDMNVIGTIKEDTKL
jgi:hypothetical protein